LLDALVEPAGDGLRKNESVSSFLFSFSDLR
jgi:hypothetical protein